VYLAWHAVSPQETGLFIDNIFVEEVVNCPEPLVFGLKDTGKDTATVYWEDSFNSGWEYVVQKAGGAAPSGNGIFTSAKEVVVTLDHNGDALAANTRYEIFVRGICDNGSKSAW